MEYGALRYLIKPVSPVQLEEVVARAVRLHQMAQDQARGAGDVPPGGQAPRRSRRAWRRGSDVRWSTLWIAYQPIVSWSRRSTFAYEALVRNEEPTLRSPPDLFEAAERLGRLQELGRAVRDRVARTLDEQPLDGAAVHQPSRHGAGRRLADLVRGAAVASRRARRPGGHRARAAGEDPRRHRARRAAALARLPHRRRRSGRRLRGARPASPTSSRRSSRSTCP